MVVISFGFVVGAVWIGDNMGEWFYFKVSNFMLLIFNLVGIIFSGVDVGGFFRNLDYEFQIRWYQVIVYRFFFYGQYRNCIFWNYYDLFIGIVELLFFVVIRYLGIVQGNVLFVNDFIIYEFVFVCIECMYRYYIFNQKNYL